VYFSIFTGRSGMPDQYIALLNNLASDKPPKVGKHVSIGGAGYSYRYRLSQIVI